MHSKNNYPNSCGDGELSLVSHRRDRVRPWFPKYPLPIVTPDGLAEEQPQQPGVGHDLHHPSAATAAAAAFASPGAQVRAGVTKPACFVFSGLAALGHGALRLPQACFVVVFVRYTVWILRGEAGWKRWSVSRLNGISSHVFLHTFLRTLYSKRAFSCTAVGFSELFLSKQSQAFAWDSITSQSWQIPCFINAYLIKAYILMFFYDAPKICISRICASKSTPSLAPLYWIHSTMLHSALLSTCTTEWIGLDPTSLTPANTSRGVIGDVFCCGAFYQAFKRTVDSLLLILESEGKHFFLWCQHCPSNHPDLERGPPLHISHKRGDSLEKHSVLPLQRNQGRKLHSYHQRIAGLPLQI